MYSAKWKIKTYSEWQRMGVKNMVSWFNFGVEA
jgi:hypothetical protein